MAPRRAGKFVAMNAANHSAAATKTRSDVEVTPYSSVRVS